MSYKIAVASTDGIYVDAHFGGASSFLIYEVNGDGSYENKEERIVPDASGSNCSTNSDCSSKSSCGSSNGSGNENGGGCGSHSDSKIDENVTLIADCRCLLCYKVGAGAERQLGRKAITAFQVNYKIEEALAKIINYYSKIDNHISLRNAR